MWRYYDILMDQQPAWVLRVLDSFPDGSQVDIWAYSRCEYLKSARRVPFTAITEGTNIDYNPQAFMIPVVSKRMAEVISGIASDDVQCIPASVDADMSSWQVLNILNCVDCIDHEKSVIQYCPANHPDRPGKPRSVIELVIDQDRAKEHHIFRLKDWEPAIIISKTLKQTLDTHKISGCAYLGVRT